MLATGKLNGAAGRLSGFGTAAVAHAESVREPGLDQHEWVSQWEALEPELEDAPADALPEVGRLVEQMLAERYYDEGSDPEIDRELEVAREATSRLDAGEDVEPGDVGAAAQAYQAVYEHFVIDLDAS